MYLPRHRTVLSAHSSPMAQSSTRSPGSLIVGSAGRQSESGWARMRCRVAPRRSGPGFSRYAATALL
jgi:hypothetical protein